MTNVATKPTTAELPHIKVWESLTYEIQQDDCWIVSFHKRISREEVEAHVPICYYVPPVYKSAIDGRKYPNPGRRKDGTYFWLLLRRS
jgi:hypothetical protein